MCNQLQKYSFSILLAIGMSTVKEDAIYCEVSNDVFEMKTNKCYSDVKVVPTNKNKPTGKTSRNGSSRKCMIVISLCFVIIMLILAATSVGVTIALVEVSKLGVSLDRNTEELRYNHSQFQYDLQQLRAYHDLHVNCPILISSCSSLPSFCPSGYYWVIHVRVYCDMTLSCGNITGGWMRVAELNMTDTSQQCPGGLMENNETGIRHCRISENSCISVLYYYSYYVPSYSSVCGRITAYQVGSTNAFRPYYQNTSTTSSIDSTYVDGIILTTDRYFERNEDHIWTFAAALDKQHDNMDSKCPCLFNRTLPPFVGEDYFCDTGNEEFVTGETGLQTDPLWGGTDCLCCDNPPWFYKKLPWPTTDNIKMRVCKDGNDENIAITEIEIYVH